MKLTKKLFEKQICQKEFSEDTCEENWLIWDPYSRLDLLSLAFIYESYSKVLLELTGFGLEVCSSLPSLAEELEPFDGLI